MKRKTVTLLLLIFALASPAVAHQAELTAKPVGVDVKNAIVELQRVAPAVLIFQVSG